MDVHVIYLSQVLDVPVQRLYMLSQNDNPNAKHRKKRHYRNYHRVILQREQAGKIRVLNVPNACLKLVQRRILNRFLYRLQVSAYASAYVCGKSLRDNAAPHIGQEMIVKLDVSQFFDHIDDDMVFLVMRQLDLSDAATSLLTHLCVCQGRLPQGAPTSPYLANLVMKPFDEKVGAWCAARGIRYTRYCDDMTFSGDRDAIGDSGLIPYVRKMLRRFGFTLNAQKTAVISSSQQQRVTGVVVNEKARVSRSERRALRQEVYFCRKFGVQESLQRRGDSTAPETYLRRLLGRLGFAVQIDPTDTEMQALLKEVRAMLHTD